MTRIAATVVVAGPDGSGKSTVAARLAEEVLAPPVLWLHHRPAVLPRRTISDEPVAEPHAQRPHGRWKSLAKLLYVFADYWLGWATQVRTERRRGGSVVLERGWWDLAVDPRRYRLAPTQPVMRALTRLVPRPDLTVVLVAESAVLAGRTSELPERELARQVEAWQEIARRYDNMLVLDVHAPVDAIVKAIHQQVGQMGATKPPN